MSTLLVLYPNSDLCYEIRDQEVASAAQVPQSEQRERQHAIAAACSGGDVGRGPVIVPPPRLRVFSRLRVEFVQLQKLRKNEWFSEIRFADLTEIVFFAPRLEGVCGFRL